MSMQNAERTYAVKVTCSPAETFDAGGRLRRKLDVQLGLFEFLLHESKRGIRIGIREGDSVERC
jgi:hypothetical protein